MSERLNIAILGASGYTGAELVRMLWTHPRATIVAMTADRRAGCPIGAVFPQFTGLDLPDLVTIADVEWASIDVCFCALPHGTTQEVISGLPGHVKVVDLSADFRLFDPQTYGRWYGRAHQALGLQKEAVYGMTEIARAAIAKARLVANPGCYPTAVQVPLVPLLEQRLILCEDIIVDAKSGVSGAGRATREGSLYCEVSEGLHAYAIASHRHGPEIEQGLTWAAKTPVTVSFTPHLVPMSRGILATIYVKLADGGTAEGLHRALASRYAKDPFIIVLPYKTTPQTRHVRGSNFVHIGVFEDRLPGRAILVAAIDNLVKGASGQAIQNMNVMCALPETMGLSLLAQFP